MDIPDEHEIKDAEPVSAPSPPPDPPAKGKRGRKKKESKLDEPTPTFPEEEVEADPEPVETTEPAAKRKRGRPRKSEPVKTTQPEPIDDGEPAQDEEVLRLDAEPEPLSDIHPNFQPSPAAATGTDANGTGGKENGALGAVGGEETASPGGKAKEKGKEEGKEKGKGKQDAKIGGPKTVQYRVGLSKRSRIAPLLKSLKKPA